MSAFIPPPASLWRRFAAIFYDSLLLAALLIIFAAPPVLLNDGPMRDGTLGGEIKNSLFFLYQLAIISGFYGICWRRGGQTLGMAAWKIKVVATEGSKIRWRQIIIRLLTAVFGLMNLTCWFNKQKLGWHERLSATRTVFVVNKAPEKSPKADSA